MKNTLFDTEFLQKLTHEHNKIIYARIISLTQNEQPIEMIEGIVQSGSIDIDGKSAIRRSCNLILTTQQLNINEIYWGFNTKIKLEIGVQNNINLTYEPIIWFKQGIFIITEFKTNQQVNNYNITISGKDKMCLLNGDISGHFNAETNLKVENYIDNHGNKTEIIQTIKYIIREMIHHYAQEPWGNIIINNVDDYGLEMLDNRSENTLYLWLQKKDMSYKYLTDDNMNNTKLTSAMYKYNDMFYTNFSDLSQDNFKYLVITEEDNNQTNASELSIITNNTEENFYIRKIESMEQIGYRVTDLVYDKDLIAAAGDTVTSVLDKIVKMLGSFEYFYDLDGRFIFQAKPTYLNTTWSSNKDLDTIEELSYVHSNSLAERTSYYFENTDLIVNIQNNPNILNIRNDFTIWGKKRSASGNEIPIHARYAIDKKPVFYFSILEQKLYCSNESVRNKLNAETDLVDWRELIYLMAQDYYQFNHADEFEVMIIESNKKYSFILETSDYLNGKTGYEQYYHDIQGFWRLLYDKKNAGKEVQVFKTKQNDGGIIKYDENGWNVCIIDDPASLLFWFDFYDINDAEFGKFSVPAIGSRTKVVNDDDVRVIMYPDVPDIIFTTNAQQQEMMALNELRTGYSYISLAETVFNELSLSTRRKSAKEVIDNLLYTYTYMNDSISLTLIPIYNLEPNIIIHVYNKLSLIDDYYEITKITVPLAYNGTMTISATKIPQQIY